MLQAILFGILQGLTEFFPVSSTGHLVMFEHIARLLGGASGPLTEAEKSAQTVQTVAVHLGTTLAVLVLFHREVVEMLKECVSILRKTFVERKPLEALQGNGRVPLVVAIVIGTIPTGIIGLALKKTFERMLLSPGAVGIALAVTGVVLWATRWFDRTGRGEGPASGGNPLTMFRAFIMGIAQGIAVTPGISRSGTTISTGLFLGLERETAGKFSFLLSVTRGSIITRTTTPRFCASPNSRMTSSDVNTYISISIVSCAERMNEITSPCAPGEKTNSIFALQPAQGAAGKNAI